MTDLEMTKLCAEAMGLRVVEERPHDVLVGKDEAVSAYYPIHDDAQAMALVKKHKMHLSWETSGTGFWLAHERITHKGVAMNLDLNRAIVECVAKMWADEVALTVGVR